MTEYTRTTIVKPTVTNHMYVFSCQAKHKLLLYVMSPSLFCLI